MTAPLPGACPGCGARVVLAENRWLDEDTLVPHKCRDAGRELGEAGA